ncbi:MAG: hypothetical protein ACOH5I_17770 [Oligoflexus sp.]
MKLLRLTQKGVLVLSSFCFLAAAKQDDTFRRYADHLQASLTAIEKRESGAELEKNVKPMFQLSKSILKEYASKHKDCQEYLEKTLTAADAMLKLSLERIEKDYHADGALPKAPNHCYQVKDLLVHPATVLVLLSKSDEQAYKQMHSELAELDAHWRFVQMRLNQKSSAKEKQ